MEEVRGGEGLKGSESQSSGETARELRVRAERARERAEEMAENKTNLGGNIGTGAGILAKRFQKSMNRAQEKVLQKLGKAMETKDEQFEQCAANLNKQQTDGSRLYKDVKAYYNAVKVMHETSKRLSQTLKDVYEPDWQGIEDLSNIMESEDLLWNDYEEKLNDQIVRTMENYTSQFSDVKERVAKRGRKLVDYDSARHHLESLQNAKKKDEAKIFKADEEFNKAQCVFEEINSELREELPVLYQSRIGCYVTVFQNISNLRDVFYKELSVLNHDIYNVMKTLETQHSTTTFVIKGLSSSSSKARKSLTISAPVLCNTAFPRDHPALSKFSIPDELSKKSTDAYSGSDEFGSSESFPSQHSVCSELEPVNESESGPADDQSNGNKRPESPVSSEQDEEDQVAVPSEESTPVSELSAINEEVQDEGNGLKEEGGGTTDQSKDLKMEKQLPANQPADSYPPGFLYKASALKTQESDEGILLMFSEGDSLLVFLDEEEEMVEGCVWAVREEDWIKHKDLTLLSGLVEESMIQRTDSN